MTDLKSLLRDAQPETAAVDVETIIDRGEHLRRRRRLGAAGASAAAALVLFAGVIGVVNRVDGPSEHPVELLAGAGDAARDAGSARIQVVMQSAAADHSSRTEIAGVVDFATSRGQLTVTTDGVQVRVIGDGATTFVSVPEADRASTNGKPWLSYPTPDTSDGILDLADPVRLLDSLREIADVETVGDEEVNGFDTTHYTATITDDDGQSEPSFVGQAAAWITDAGLPTRLIVDYDFGPGEIVVTVNITDFGIAVDVTDPPAESDVFAGTEEMANRWLQPRLVDADAAAGFADGLVCSVLPLFTEALQQQVDTMTDEQIAGMERALAEIDAQADGIDDSTAEGAERKATLLASTSMLRALVTAARTGEPIDPVALQTTFDQLGRSCTDS